jgi:LAO/AO transport system kinase
VTDRNAAALLLAAKAGSRGDLARLVSVIESGGAPAEAAAPLIYRAAAPFVIGLTGAPGAGKSTLTDHLLTAALAGDLVEGLAEIAVLCVDPTSPFSGGALLGDRVRMQRHGTDDRVFVRSMATRGHLGGLALAVPDAT